jgi:DNA replication and repair protein RecF
MQITTLQVENFRNIERAEVRFADRISLFAGDNGSGKTSLLEAVHVALTGRSQRRAPNDVMLQKTAEFFRVAAEVSLGRVAAKSEYAFTTGRPRTLKLNNNPVRSLAVLLEEFAVVSFAPEDLQLVLGAPATRRAAVDFILSTGSAAYLETLTRYHRAVLHKNRLLKSLPKSGAQASGRSELDSFNAQIVEHGVKIMQARQAYSRETVEDLSAIYAQLSDDGEAGASRYAPAVQEAEAGSWADAFERELGAQSERERTLGVSLVGPHRDDWQLSLAGRPARQFASQGQARSLAIAMKLAGFRYLERVRGDTPILLFDEIFGELDSGRGRRLLHLVGNFAQALITSVRPITAADLGADATSFEITDGRLIRRD